MLPKKNFTELHRLTLVVRSIENDCQLTPTGGYKMMPNHELRPNHHFYGLDLATATKAASWQHFRSPQSNVKRHEIEKENVIFSSSFLDSIEDDLPKGSWSIQSDCTKQHVTVRSLQWPGYFAYHRLNTGLFGGCYFGEGLKNIDLAFML